MRFVFVIVTIILVLYSWRHALGEEKCNIESLKYLTPLKVCSLLSLPGDIHLNTSFYMGNPNSGGGQVIYHTVDLFGLFGMLADVVSGKNAYQKYSHSGMVSDISIRGEMYIRSWFMGDEIHGRDTTDPNNKTNFLIVRTKKNISEGNELWLYNADTMDLGMGVCSDAVNKLTGDFINPRKACFPGNPLATSIVNFIRVTNPIVYAAYRVDTPTRLANSRNVNRICEIENNKLVYPESIMTKDLLYWVSQARQSSNTTLAHHADSIYRFLYGRNIIDSSGKVLKDKLIFDVVEKAKKKD